MPRGESAMALIQLGVIIAGSSHLFLGNRRRRAEVSRKKKKVIPFFPRLFPTFSVEVIFYFFIFLFFRKHWKKHSQMQILGSCHILEHVLMFQIIHHKPFYLWYSRIVIFWIFSLFFFCFFCCCFFQKKKNLDH